MGLQGRIIIFTIPALLLVFLLLGFLGIRAIQESTRRSLNDRLVMAQLMAQRFDEALDRALFHIQEEASSINLEDPNPEPEQVALQNIVAQEDIFASQAFILDNQGNLLLKEPAQVTSSLMNYFPEALQTKEPIISDTPIRGDNNTTLIPMAIPIKEGVLIVAIDLSRLNLIGYAQPLGFGQSAYIQVVNKDGTVVSSTISEPLFQTHAHASYFAQLIQDKATAVSTCHSCHEAEARPSKDILAFAPLSKAPLGIVIREPEEVALAPAHHFQNQMILAGGLALLGALGLVSLTTRWVVRPIRQLTKASQRMASGDLITPISRVGDDEIAVLARSLDEMRSALKASHQDLERWSLELMFKVKQRTKELSTLLEISTAFTVAPEADKALEEVMAKAVAAFPAADAGALFLYDSDLERLVARSSFGYDPEPLSQVRMKPGEAILGRVFSSGQPLLCSSPEEISQVIGNMSEENRILFEQAREGVTQPQSAMAAPLIFKNSVIGSLILVNLRQRGTFSTPDLEFLQSVANQIAIITENSRLLGKVSQAQALEEANRLKDEFLSAISHELLTPLTSIKASADLLLATSPHNLSDPGLSLLNNITRNVERLSSLVGELLDLARLRGGAVTLRHQICQVGSLIEDAVATFRPLMEEKRQTLLLDIPNDLSSMVADRQRVEQVILNLLSNACRYTPEGGIIHISAQEDSDKFTISVSDNGPGVPTAKQELIFERFYSSSPIPGLKEGTGLGLAIAKALVELHGGSIGVKSRRGAGATFYFTIPKEDTNHESANY